MAKKFSAKKSVAKKHAGTKPRGKKIRHLLDLHDVSEKEMAHLIERGLYIKKHPDLFSDAAHRKTLLMMFQKPSLRTHISFHVAMAQMGGDAIFYDLRNAPLGKKESIEDTAAVASKYVDAVMIRLYKHRDLQMFARHSHAPVINGLSDFSHPCQILGDLMSIQERLGKLRGLKLAYVGDSRNNVTHSLLLGCSKMGVDISVGCPAKEEYLPLQRVVADAKLHAKKSGSRVEVVHDAAKAVKGADIVYTDSWMSYGIPEAEEARRVKDLKPFQVTRALLAKAKKESLFMNCLPARRGFEETAAVIDGRHSIVFEEAFNRLHIQKAILLFLWGQL